MHWQYKILTRLGKEIVGGEKGRKKDVISRLEEKGSHVIALSPDFSGLVNSFLVNRKVPNKILVDFFEDFQNMLLTGIPAGDILVSLQETTGNTVLKSAVIKIKDSLTEGLSLAEALERTEVFPWLVVHIVRVGEKAGRLPQVFGDLAKFYKEQEEIKSSIINASVYPAFVAGVLILLMFYLSLKVIPQLETMLPPQALQASSTRIVLSLTVFIRRAWVIFLLVPVAGIWLYRQFKTNNQDAVAGKLYRLPGIGALVKDSAIALYFLNFSILQKSGIPLNEAFELIGTSFPHAFVAKKFFLCRDYILGGLSFWEALRKDDFFPFVISSTIRKGEEMGRLDEYFGRVHLYYAKKLSKEINTLVSLVQPVLLGVCAGLLLLVGLSFIVPIYQNLSTIAGGGR